MKENPLDSRSARDRPGVGILSVAPAQPLAHRRYQRLFRRTILASPPLDSPMSLLNRFLRNSSNICIMCSRFPRPPPPPHPLARSHTRRHTLLGLTQHPSSLPLPATGPGRSEFWFPLAPRRWRLTHSPVSSPGQWRGRPPLASGSPRAVPGRRSHASSTSARKRRTLPAHSTARGAEGGLGRPGGRGY